MEDWLKAFVHFAGLYETRGTCFELMKPSERRCDEALVAMGPQTAQLMRPEKLEVVPPGSLKLMRTW